MGDSIMKRDLLYNVAGNAIRLVNRISANNTVDQDKVVVFNTAEHTDNLGDYIIMYYCNQVLEELFVDKEFYNVSTHRTPSKEDENIIRKTSWKFVCGTNLLTSHIEQWWNWRLPEGIRGKLPYRKVVLLGAGWGSYQDECSAYSAMIYKSLLDPRYIHSVRDEYTAERLRKAGIKNVINTGCPTMWKLTPDFCSKIPVSKNENVVTTITDYRRDHETDQLMLDILSRNYQTVFLWIQGKEDEAYLRTNMQMIFQDPMACLNPRKKVKEIIAQGLQIHHSFKNQAELDEKVNLMLEKVGLSREHATRYPQQFSGGQRQRIGIARSLAVNPKFIVCDEPVSALDVSIQAQVVNLMKDLQDELGTTYLFIAHDLSMVKYISDRIGVMHLGHIVETGTTDEIFENPIHPYTRSLLSAIPHPNPRVEKNRVSLEYDKNKEGVDYTKGTIHNITSTHYVLATDEEFARWSKEGYTDL